jgi:hypothetical protein
VPRPLPEADITAIEEAVSRYPDGAALADIAASLPGVPLRTLQYRLKLLTDSRKLTREGTKRGAKYRLQTNPVARQVFGSALAGTAAVEVSEIPLSPSGWEIRNSVRRPLLSRRPVGYNHAFLEAYRPNVTFYLTAQERHHFQAVGRPRAVEQPAGTFARQILGRLLIDLSFNSSRLEGNTYSLLDTKRLIELGEQAEGKEQADAQMILNHKEAIEFLSGSAEEIGFNRYTIQNLHALLSNNLLADPDAPGRLRHIAVGIEGSVFQPLGVPQLIEECFDQILETAAAIEDPFEQSFFVMVQLPYLQPFDDVNKRVSRLAANIPLIKRNLSPLSFTEVPRQDYTDAMLGIYELNRVGLLKDIYLWAYERSAAQYAAVRQSLGEPDPFKFHHRAALRTVLGNIVRDRLDSDAAARYAEDWANNNIEPADRKRFVQVASTELHGLHEGNFVRYGIRPNEFAAWRKVWPKKAP